MRRHWPWLSLLVLACAGVITFDAWLATCGFYGCPSRADIRAFHPSEGGNVYDRNGRLLGHLENVRRVNVPISSVPPNVRDAFVATEDRRFYEHNGLDWHGVLRAVARNFSAGGIRQGFSTITMQVAHNSFLQDRYHGRSLRRKLVELRISRLLESQLTKDQILEHYLNVIYLGNGVNGIEAASLDLFGKNANQLTLAEGALLAALPKAPSSYTPRRNPTRAVQRRNIVLGLMADQGYITKPQAADRREDAAADRRERMASVDHAGAERARRGARARGLGAPRRAQGRRRQRLHDGRLHAAALGRPHDAQALRVDHGRDARDDGHVTDDAQGALVAMDPANGDIRALVPGQRTQRGGFNRAFYASRQPGSAFKPFVYAAALAAGYKPSEDVDDDPVEVDIGRTVWQPANYNNEYNGRITFARALMLSANAATVRVSRAIGERAVIAAARRNGITSPLTPVPSIALGAEGVTPLELVTSYAPFANGGNRVKPRLVTRIEAPDGTLLWSRRRRRRPAMDPRDAYEITEMLQGVVNYGTGKTIRDYGVTGPIAGKTGTTNSGKDVWFVGYTPTLVPGVWFGYDMPRQISGERDRRPSRRAGVGGVLSGRLARAARRRLRRAAGDGLGGRRSEERRARDAVVPGAHAQWFKPGSEPTETCTCTRARRRARSRSTRTATSSTPPDRIRSNRRAGASRTCSSASFAGKSRRAF